MNNLRRMIIIVLAMFGTAFQISAAEPSAFTKNYDRTPIDPTSTPYWQSYINRDRLYDYYAKQALYFGAMDPADLPEVLPQFPGLDGDGALSHWGNQNDQLSWTDDRPNQTNFGSMASGTLELINKYRIPRTVCVKLGDQINVAFNPKSLRFATAWKGPLVKWTDVRRGLVHPLYIGSDKPIQVIKKPKPAPNAQYLGLYRNGSRVVFAYLENGQKKYRTASVKNGTVVESFLSEADATSPGPAQWPQRIITKGHLGNTKPYAIDTLTLPFKNPWNALLYLGGVDFISPTRIAVSTLYGDVWICDISDNDLTKLTWKRFATGLYQPLGLKVVDGVIHVICRDSLTALHDLNGDDEADFYQCISNVQETHISGHFFITGLGRDNQGRWYYSSSAQGVCRVSADGKQLEVLATGFRFPNGIGINTDGSVVLSSLQEGNWTPATAICDVLEGDYFGYGGPRDGDSSYTLPMLYLPRGEDSSAGGQAYINSDRWGPVKDNWIHLSGALAKHFLVLREVVNGKSQAAAIPLAGEFLSGSHRARMSPFDGQLYVAGAQGYINYGMQDGSLQRVRYTGGPFHYPSSYETRANGILLTFDQPQPVATASADRWFAQQWNYLYSFAYGSPEFSVKHPNQKGHDAVEIRAVHRLNNGKQLFIEIPQLNPVNQLHLYYQGAPKSKRLEIFATVHNLGEPFTNFPNYKPIPKIPITAVPQVFDPTTMIQACTACHHPTEKIIGPSFAEIRERYANNPQGIVDWAMSPQNKTPELPPMPSFYFLGQENLMKIANKILSGDKIEPDKAYPAQTNP